MTIKDITVIGIKMNRIKGFRDGNPPVKMDIIPCYSIEKLPEYDFFVVYIDIQLIKVNEPNADGISINTIFDTGDRQISRIPTTADTWLFVDLSLVAIDHARLVFNAECESIGLSNEGYLPLFSRDEIFERLRTANFQALN
jgi:hypothetical protein